MSATKIGDRWMEVVVPVMIGLLAILGAPTSLPDADAGEFATIAWTGGIAHPPGYPFLSILLRGAALVKWPGVPFVTTLALVSVASAVFAAAVLQRLLRRLLSDDLAAALAVLIVFAAAPVLRVANNIEPFALNLALAAIAMHSSLALFCGDRPGRASAFALGLAFGLGFCNHHTLALMLPMAIAAMVPRRSLTPWLVGGIGMGLLPLTYFVYARQVPSPYTWGDWSSLPIRLLTHLSRAEYGTTSLAHASAASSIPLLVYEGHDLVEHLSGVFLLVALLGAWSLRRHPLLEPADPSKRRFLILSGLCFVLTGPGLISLFPLSLEGMTIDIVQRFVALPLFLLAPFIGTGLARILRRGPQRQTRSIATASVVALHVALQFPAADRRMDVFSEHHVRNVFATLATARRTGAHQVLVTHGDADFFGSIYGKYVLDLGPDVEVLQEGLWTTDWYRRAASRRLGLGAEGSTLTLDQALTQLSGSFEVFSTVWSKDSAVNAHASRSYPIGMLIRLLDPNEPEPPLAGLYDANRHLYADVLWLPSAAYLRSAHVWETQQIEGYRLTWRALETAFHAQGDEKRALDCAAHAAEIGTGISAHP